MQYQRNQVAWVIARCLAFEPHEGFERGVTLKLQRLIDTDRATSADGGQLAFLDGALPGKGTTAQFSEEASFLLLIALLLLEGGLTQSRVVRLVREFRDELCRQYEWIISNPIALPRGRQKETSDGLDLEPARITSNPAHLSYVVVSGNLADREGDVEHRLCRNNTELLAAVAALAPSPRPLITLELTNRAWSLWHWLPQAPHISRGRRRTT